MDTKTILVVEDEPSLRRMITKHLAKMGYTVHEAEHGEAALNWLEKNTAPDLVCLDLALPSISGFRVCEHIRSNGKTTKVPVLIITARTSMQDHTFALEMGADAFLEKPFRMKDLEHEIATLLSA